VQLHLTLPPVLVRRGVGFAISAAALAGITAALAPPLDEDHILEVALLYMLVVLLASAAWGYAVGLTSAVAADLLVNFFFVPPLHKFTVQEPGNVVALVIFLAVASTGASMLSLLRRQVRLLEARREETATLLRLSQELARAVSPREGMYRLCQDMAHVVHARSCSLLVRTDGWRTLSSSASHPPQLSRDEAALADAATTSGEPVRSPGVGAGRAPRGSAAAADARLTFVPFPLASAEKGAIRFSGTLAPPAVIDERRLLEAFASEASLAVHRARLSEEASRVDALQRADELKTALLSSVSHDLRSPLTAIKAAIDSLQDADVAWTEDDRRAFLATIAEQTERLTGTVTDLLDMSRLEGGATQPHLEPIEAKALLAEVALASRTVTGDRAVLVEAPDGVWLRADYALLVQALGNLVSNAGRYSIPDGRITVTAERDDGRIRLSVADEGPGIAAEDLPHIFEKFYRGAMQRKIAGSGLGLAIVKAMVELCNGTVTVESSPSGTVFTVALPASPPPR
jgi:two-component system sensor histidine kinase KdpD